MTVTHLVAIRNFEFQHSVRAKIRLEGPKHKHLPFVDLATPKNYGSTVTYGITKTKTAIYYLSHFMRRKRNCEDHKKTRISSSKHNLYFCLRGWRAHSPWWEKCKKFRDPREKTDTQLLLQRECNLAGRRPADNWKLELEGTTNSRKQNETVDSKLSINGRRQETAMKYIIGKELSP